MSSLTSITQRVVMGKSSHHVIKIWITCADEPSSLRYKIRLGGDQIMRHRKTERECEVRRSWQAGTHEGI